MFQEKKKSPKKEAFLPNPGRQLGWRFKENMTGSKDNKQKEETKQDKIDKYNPG